MTDETKRRFEIISRRRAYEGFFALDQIDLRHELFGGGWSPLIPRELFCISNAVGILPYDPVTGRIILIEQFRTGPLAAVKDIADADPWIIETPAGLIEIGEDPEAAARRELTEECSLVAGRMELMQRFYPSPGASAELVHLFVAEVDLSQAKAGVHGLPSEHEDIMNHILTTEEAEAWLQGSRSFGVTAVMSLLWLRSNLSRLRNQWTSADRQP